MTAKEAEDLVRSWIVEVVKEKNGCKFEKDGELVEEVSKRISLEFSGIVGEYLTNLIPVFVFDLVRVMRLMKVSYITPGNEKCSFLLPANSEIKISC